MTRVDLSAIWVCADCHTCFAFETDMRDHMQKTNHTQISMINLDSYNSKTLSHSQNDIDWQVQNK